MRSSLLLLLIMFASVITLSCGDQPGNRGDGEVTIRVDPRMELLNIVQFLAGSPGIRDPGTDYSKDVREYFSRWSDHEAVDVIRELGNQGFSYDAPVTAVLHLSDPPDLEQSVPWSENLQVRAGGLTNLQRFSESLRSFAQDTDFMVFWKDHSDDYRIICDVYRSIVEPGDAELLESLFGMTRSSYSVLPAPLSHHGFGSRIQREDGTLDVFCTIMGETGLSPGTVDTESALFFRSFVWHEFAHSFVNPLCSEYADRIDETMILFIPVRDVMTDQAYPTWQICVREHLVRAAVVRLIGMEYGEEASVREIEVQLHNGFIYIEPLLGAFDELDRLRVSGETFESMFVVFLGVFDGILETGPAEYAALLGMTINMVLTLDLPIVYVTPTAEEDISVQSRIGDYVLEICEMFNPSAEVLPDTLALQRDLSGKTVIAYGTIRGNLYLRAISEDLPFDVTTYGAVETDTLLTGHSMRLISALPNPREEGCWLLVYTACSARDVIGINSVNHGPTEFVVADGTTVLQAGYYRRNANDWSF